MVKYLNKFLFSFFISIAEKKKDKKKMASTYVAGGEESKKQQQVLSPRNLRRTWSSNSSASCNNQGVGSPPKCVCAPATHARSFKCRLHRVNSEGHSSSPPLPQKLPVSNSSAHTVQAQ